MARRVLVVLLVVAVAWLGFRAVRAFDQDRHAAEAAAVLSAPDRVTYQLPPPPDKPSRPDVGADGRFSYRPGTWLSVVELEGLEPVAGDERYLVFLRNWAGWTLAGSTSPRADGTAQVRSGAEPRPPTIYEVIVTRAVDDATSVPHGQPVLQWFDASLAPPKARRFDFARGA
ncbi:MAG TPA: hypothetical protein VGW74_21650 [Propionibacteriaceae bacterium]|nr:hypothetical protein [Propionibacteriaceae bacterium]